VTRLREAGPWRWVIFRGFSSKTHGIQADWVGKDLWLSLVFVQ
jgi:hypothetical protein